MSDPVVSIVMGSDSDLKVMKAAAEALDELGLPYELTVLSAHRTPRRAMNFAERAAGRGIKVIIAGAGGAAHLAGVVAALTPLPVVGVPLRSALSLDGWDSVLSTLQMPPGVPVATVALDGAHNAGVLAAQIIGTGDPAVREQVAAYKHRLQEKVAEKAAKIEAQGFRAPPA